MFHRPRRQFVTVVGAGIVLLGGLPCFRSFTWGQDNPPAVQKAELGRPVIQRLFPAFTASVEPTSLPTDQQVTRRLQEARRLLEEGQLSHGMALLQLVLDEPVDSYYRDNSRWVRSRRMAEELIIGLGPKGWEAYQLQYGGQAEQLLQEALASKDLGQLADIMQRFFLTAAGFRATNILAKHQLDRGRPGLAAIYLDRILQCPLHAERANDALHAMYAVALTLSGRENSQGPATPQTPLNLGGARWTAEQLQTIVSKIRGLDRTDVHPWHIFQGNPQRTGVAEGGLPLLSPEWSHPITRDPQTKAFVEETLDLNDLLPNRQPTVLSIFPILLDDLIIYRDFHGVWAVDALSGVAKWKYTEGGSIELAMKSNRMIHPSTGVSQTAVISMLVQNSVYGSLSTDGERVYLIDQLMINPAAVNASFSQQKNADGESLERSSNRLTALDAQTGEPLWRVGGADPEASSELADTYFFGPPLPANGELYAVGESRSELRLYCLNRETGGVRWSQVLALSDRRVDVDLFRRSLACHLAYADGILICPTNLFRVVAIDPLTRSLLWEYDYSGDKPPETRRFVSGMSVVPPPSVIYANDAPAVADGVVVLTSASGKSIHGLDLQTGRSLWHADRGEDQYLAGVFNRRAILVGGRHVRALDVKTGNQVWKQPVPFPSGRGISLGTQYLLPTSDGAVVALDLETGEVSTTIRGRDDDPVGNLFVRSGQVISAGLKGVEAFPLFADIEKEVEQRLSEHSTDPVGLYRRAQLRISRGDAIAAVRDLLVAVRQPQPAKESLAARSLLFEIAGREMLARPELAGELVEDLGRLASNKEQKGIHLRLLAEHELSQNRFAQALAAVDKHAGLKSDGEVIDATDMVRQEKRTWARTFLRRLQEQAELQQYPIREELRGRLADSAHGDVANLEETVFVLGETSIGPEADLALAKRYLELGRLSEAELSFLRAARATDEPIAMEAHRSLASICSRLGLQEDADQFLRQLIDRFPDPPAVDADQPAGSLKVGQISWEFDQILAEFERTRTYSRTKPLSAVRPLHLPYFAKHDVSFNFRDFLVEIGDRQTGVRQWFVPLPRGSDYNISPTYSHLGHLVLVTLQDTVYAISTLERKMLWSRKLSAAAPNANRSSTYFVVDQGVGRRNLRLSLGPCDERYLVVRGLTDLLVLDPRNGEPLWKRRKVRRGDEIFGDGEVLFVVSADHSYVAHRTSDGQVLREGSLKSALPHLVQTLGRRLLLFQQSDQQKVLNLWDPWTQKDVWSRSFPTMTRMCSADEDYIALLTNERTLTVLSRVDGEVLLQDDLPDTVGQRFNLSVFSDLENFYVAVDQQGKANIFPFNISNSSIETQPLNGLLRAYDRSERNKLRWQREVEATRLITSPGTELPLLISLRNEVLKRGQLGTRVSIIDKRDGRILHEEERAEYTPFSEFAYHGVEKWIELRAYNVRLRFDFLTNAEAKRREEIKSRPTLGTLLEKLGKAVTDRLQQTEP